MGNNIIKSFTINGLFGTTNVTIPFDDKVKILIGENGLGKTQILNMLYFVLTKQWEKLKNMSFDDIILETIDDTILIEKEYVEHFDRESYERDFNKLSRAEKHKLIGDNWENNNKHYNKKELKKIEIVIENIFKAFQTLYLPTYRRIEVDLVNLDIELVDDFFDELAKNPGVTVVDNGNSKKHSLIKFGMEDVENRLNTLTLHIKDLSNKGFSKISVEILRQLIKGLPKLDYDLISKIDEDDLEIILARVGNEISKEDKEGIRKLITNKDQKIEDIYSLFFLQKLIEIYDQQRELDNRIKSFRDVCNKYLTNKKVIYDESKIEIYIKADGANKPLNLSKLSSGEKQIISIFSKVYLSEPDERYILLFDEPELSLSIFWQKNLLPDIVDSGKCEFLFAVTHSPFIFENKLDKYTTSLGEYITPLTPELVG